MLTTKTTLWCDHRDGCVSHVSAASVLYAQRDAVALGWVTGDPMHGTPDLCALHASQNEKGSAKG